MSALAQFQAMTGGRVSGSERAFDRGERSESRAQLERLGIAIHPQDGSGVSDDCAVLVVSTAVEDRVPDMAAARARGIPVLHRSELLAHYVRSYRTLAVGGTSGKSTVVAMVFEILRAAARLPSVITGGDLRFLQAEGLWGNAWHGGSDLLVAEADESDGSLVRYEPAVGIVLNLQRDHREMAEVAEMFATFRSRTRETFIVGEDAVLAGLADGACVFGFGSGAAVRAEDVTLEPGTSRFEVDGVRFTLPVPGHHNVSNAVAAIAACRAIGVPLADMVGPLDRFQGVARRFQILGSARGVEVVDDFAHNPAKLKASIETAQARTSGRARGATPKPGVTSEQPGGGRLLAVYQPHGYGPTRFLRADLVQTFAEALEPDDRLWMLEVFYAGGTADRDFSAADIVAEIGALGTHAEFARSRPWLIQRIAAEAREGDVVLVMGARDPSLTDLARAILEAVAAGSARRSGAVIG
jgi:UDP-N-acetylmuramate--alanine ligase